METKTILIIVGIILVLISSSVGAYFMMSGGEEDTSSTPAASNNTTSTPPSTPPPSTPPSTPASVGANPGEAISCTGYNPRGAGAIYRYDGDRKMRHYPNPDIAGSWDPNWPSGANRKIDCTGFTLGNDIQMNPAKLKAKFYEHCDYNGAVSELAPGSYDIGAMGIGNDAISSIRIPSGLKVTLYEHAGFQGRSIDLTSDTPCLVNNGFNDFTSSIKISTL